MLHLTIADTDDLFRDIAPIRFRGILVNWLFLMISPPQGQGGGRAQRVVRGRGGGGANANLCTKAEPKQMSQAQRVEKSFFFLNCRAHHYSSEGRKFRKTTTGSQHRGSPSLPFIFITSVRLVFRAGRPTHVFGLHL